MNPVYCRRCGRRCPDKKELGALPDLWDEGDIEGASEILNWLNSIGACVCEYASTGSIVVAPERLDFKNRETRQKVNDKEPLFQQTPAGKSHQKATRKILAKARVNYREYEQQSEPKTLGRPNKRSVVAWWYGNLLLRLAVLVAKYPRLDTNSKEGREARYLFKLIERHEKQKKIGNDADRQMLHRIREFGEKVLSDDTWALIEKYGKTHITEIAKSPLMKELLEHSGTQKGRQGHLIRLLSQVLSDPLLVANCHDSIALNKLDPQEQEMLDSVGREVLRLRNQDEYEYEDDGFGIAEESFDWEYIDGLAEAYIPDLESLRRETEAWEIEQQAVWEAYEPEYKASIELVAVLRESGLGDYELMQLDALSYEELKSRVYEHLLARLRAIEGRIAFLSLQRSNPPKIK